MYDDWINECNVSHISLEYFINCNKTRDASSFSYRHLNFCASMLKINSIFDEEKKFNEYLIDIVGNVVAAAPRHTKRASNWYRYWNSHCQPNADIY